MTTVRMSSKGQVVLPREVREALGLAKGSLMRVELAGKAVVLTPVEGEEPPVPDWRRWRGVLGGEGALQELLEEHRRELERDGQRSP